METRVARSVFGIAICVLAIHLVTNHRYGFHRDELQTLDDAQHPAWGYVVYPPLAPMVARAGVAIFGETPWGLRVFSALAVSIAALLAGLMAREFGGAARAQTLATAMAALSPVAVLQGALFQYVAFDYLWCVAIAWLMVRLVRTDDARLWVPIGAVIGLGTMTRYTIAFFIAGVVAAVILTPLRRHLRTPWLWAGVAVSVLIFLPNFLWQVRNDFVSLEFLRSIHERDVRLGRTAGFLIEQWFVPANIFTVPWWIAGLWFCARSRFRAIGWMFVVPFALFVVMNGRSYYTTPEYPMLLAAGAMVWERSGRFHAAAVAALICGAIFSATLMLPLAPPGSQLFRFVAGVHDNFVEQIGWPELAASVADVHRRLPATDRAGAAILAGNYGEAGALRLYGRPHGLPLPISGVNSHWHRGYPTPAPRTLVMVGFSRERAARLFQSCEVAGVVRNRYGIENEESGGEILICREPRMPWPELWTRLRSFG